MANYLGGMRPIGAGWLGRTSLYVDFVSNYADRVIQLYAGRTLIGVTEDPADTRVVGQLVPSEAPTPLTLLAVAAADGYTDFGDDLPQVPWNRYEFRWSASSYAADAHHFEITASAAAGEAVDTENVIANVPYVGERNYSFRLPPLPTSGEWIYRLTPYDDAKPDGNAGTATNITIDALIAPPDFRLDRYGNRFDVEVVDGIASFSFNY